MLLFSGSNPADATSLGAKNSEESLLGAIYDLDDAALVQNLVGRLLGLFGSQQRTIADSRGLSRPGTARNMDADFRRRAVGFFVPLRRHRDELAVGIAGNDVGENHRRQLPGTVQLLAPVLEVALVGKLAQYVLEVEAL